ALLSNGTWRAALEYQPPGETTERDMSWLDWSFLADLSQDGRSILFNETREGGGANSSIYLRRADAPTPVKIGEGFGDALSVAGMSNEMIAIYPLDGGNPIAVSGVQKGEIPVQWSADGSSLFVYRPTVLPAQVFRINLSTGARELWKQFTPTDPAGVYKIAPICMTRDASAYAYDALRTMSDLYVVEGLR